MPQKIIVRFIGIEVACLTVKTESELCLPLPMCTVCETRTKDFPNPNYFICGDCLRMADDICDLGDLID